MEELRVAFSLVYSHLIYSNSSEFVCDGCNGFFYYINLKERYFYNTLY